MKAEDIDKEISMPDIDAEWVKFEREIIGKRTMARKLIVWGISTAASVILLAGVLLFIHNSKNTEPLQARQKNPTTIKKTEYNKDAETEQEVAQASAGCQRLTRLAEKRDATSALGLTKYDPDLQRRIAALTIVPNSTCLGNNIMRLRGTSNRNDSVLILMDGTPFIDTLMSVSHLAKGLYRQGRCIDSIMVYKDEQSKKQYVEQYGERARYAVVVIKTAPDTLCDAYVREHPELTKSRRFVEGFVMNENGEPLADAWVHITRGAAGTVTDSVGHFAFWLPLTETKLQAECTGYSSSAQILPSDTTLTFRLRKIIPQRKVIRIR